MHLRNLRLLCLYGLALPISCACFSRAQSLTHPHVPEATIGAAPELHLDGVGKGTVALNGPWQFHLGDDIAWAKSDWDDSRWEQIEASQPWGAQGHDSYSGVAWYRRHIEVIPATGVKPEFTLLMGKVDDAYEVYWNGVLVGNEGKMPPRPLSYFRPPQRSFGLGPIRGGVLAIRVWKAPLNSFDSGQLGGFEALPLLGSPADIEARKTIDDYKWIRSRQFNFGITFLYGLVTVLGLVAWLRDRQQRVFFWMAAFCFSPTFNLIVGGLRLPIPAFAVTGIEQPVFALWDISLWFLLIWLLRLNDQRRLVYWVAIASLIDAIASSVDGAISLLVLSPRLQVTAQIADGFLTAVVIGLEVIPLILVARTLILRKTLSPERWLVAIFACFAEGIEALQTAAEQGERFTHWTWGNKMGAPLLIVNGNSINAATLGRTALLAALIYAIYRNSLETRRRQGALEQEYKNARELQQVLVPEHLPALPGFALTSAYRPAQEVGGDFFQIIPVADGSTLVVLGDVSGKGLKAAMAVSLIVGAARMIAEYSSNPAEILAGLNRRLYGRMQDGFVTAIAMRLDENGSCTLATAGHPAPFLNQRQLDLPGALPLGLTPNATFQEHCFKLQVGDHFALYTDGLLEARNQSGELYGFERLESLFATKPNATQATEAAINFGQDDDITVLTLTRLAASEESTAVHSIPALTPAPVL